jgi:hypothetical protein
MTTQPMDQIVSVVKMNTELLEIEIQPEPLGNLFRVPKSEMILPDCITSVMWKPDCNSSPDSNITRISEHPEESKVDHSRKLNSQLSLRECDSIKNSFESDDLSMTNFGFFLDTKYQIKEGIDLTFCTAQQVQHFIDKQATEILQLKANLQLADCEIRKEIGRKLLLQDEFEEFKKNAAVVQREKEELEKEMVALKESVIKQKADWRSVELQINAENYGLQRALRHLGRVNEGMSEQISQLETEAIQSRQTIELLQKEKQEMLNTPVTNVRSAKKAERLALGHAAALSNALIELEVAAECSNSVAESENAESDLQNTGESKTDSKSTETKKSWMKKWLIKRGLSEKQKPEESELTKLLRSTGILMMKRAKDLKEQAKMVAAKGKRLTERAKLQSRK